MSRHVHAELMAQYAEDAKQNYRPWIFWEYRTTKNSPWQSLARNPGWDPAYQYRKKRVPLEIKQIIREGNFILPYGPASIVFPGDRIATFREVIEDYY